MDKRQPPVGGLSEADDLARRARERDARVAGRNTEDALLAQGDPGFGYRKEELPLVFKLKETRDRWRALGRESEIIVTAESQAWMDRFNKKFQVVEIIEIFDEEDKVMKKKENLKVAEPANDYRIVRAFGGSTLDKGVKYHEEFDLPGEFSIREKLIPHIEELIQKKLKGRTDAPGV